MIQSWWESTSDAKFVKSVPNRPVYFSRHNLLCCEQSLQQRRCTPRECVFFLDLDSSNQLGYMSESWFEPQQHRTCMWVATMSCQGIIKKDTYCVVVEVPLPLKDRKAERIRMDCEVVASNSSQVGGNLVQKSCSTIWLTCPCLLTGTGELVDAAHNSLLWCE
jgi:hypothetical protein